MNMPRPPGAAPDTRGAPPLEARDGAILVAAGVAALVVRLAYLAVAQKSGLFVGLFLDAKYYADLAVRIRAGLGAGDHPYLMSPLYPYVLSLFVGDAGALNEGAVRAFQAILDAGTVVLIVFLALRLAGRRAATVAGILGIIYAPMIYFTGIVLVATTQAFLLTLGLALLVEADRAARLRVSLTLAAGLAFGLAAALRPTVLLVALAAAIVLIVRAVRRRNEDDALLHRLAAGAIVLGVVLVVAPFTVRNIAKGGEFALLSVNGGFNFYVGNNTMATGVFHLPEAIDPTRDVLGKSYAERVTRRDLTYREASAWWFSRATQDIRGAPAAWATRLVKKLALFFHPVEIPQLGSSFHWFRKHAWPLALPIDARVILIFALAFPAALWAAGRSREITRYRWPALVAGTYAVAIALFFVNARYRLPVMPAAIVLASVTVDALASVRRAKEHRGRYAGVAVALVAVMAASQWVYAKPLAVLAETGTEHRHIGMAMYRQGRFVEAVEAYRRSLAIGDSAITRNNLANALKRLERFDEAREQYHAAITMNPADAIAWYNLGNLRRDHDRNPAAAIEAYENALRFAPDMTAAHFNLGTVRMAVGDRDKARVHFLRVLQVARPTDRLIPEARAALDQLEHGVEAEQTIPDAAIMP
ncbi:tetratricopeptide repeat protein [bacterium]|nr:tetratricopeptide repeat protein [bacterium]